MIINEFEDLNFQEVEESVKARTKGEAGAAKTLCMPFEQDTLPMVSNTLPEGTFLLYSGFRLILKSLHIKSCMCALHFVQSWI